MLLDFINTTLEFWQELVTKFVFQMFVLDELDAGVFPEGLHGVDAVVVQHGVSRVDHVLLHAGQQSVVIVHVHAVREERVVHGFAAELPGRKHLLGGPL